MKIKFKLPIKTVILSTFVVQILFVGIGVLFLSYLNSTKAINKIVYDLKVEINKRIETELNAYFRCPVVINKSNANNLKNELLDINKQEQFVKHFTDQIKIYPNVNSVYFGNIKGGIANAGRENNGESLYHIITDNFSKGNFAKYKIDDLGNRVELISQSPNFDARTRPWFIGAIETKDLFWSDIYVLFTGQDIAISSSYPVYNEKKELLGVMSTDLFLSYISKYLKSLDIGKSGESFIIERSGKLIAGSKDISLFTKDENTESYTRSSIFNTESHLLKKIAEISSEYLHSDFKINGAMTKVFEYKSETHYLLITSFSPYEKIDWLILTVIPKKDFMAEISRSNINTLLIIFIFLLLSIFIAVYLSGHIAKPIKNLSENTKQIISGKWIKVNTNSWLLEINSLAYEFDKMSDQLQSAFINLKNEIQVKENYQNILNTEKERLAVTLKSIGDGVITTDVAGNIISMNPIAEQLTGWLNEEAQHIPIEEVFIIKDDDKGNKKANPVEIALKTKKIGELSNNTILISKDNREMIVSDISAPIKNNQNEVIGAILVFRDITEKQRLLQVVHNTQKIESIGILAGGIAHDFNNLLASIYGFIELAVLQTDNEKVSYFLSQASTSIKRAKSLTQQLITFSEGGVPIKETVNFVEFLQDSINFAVSETDINVNYFLQTEPYLVDIDKGQITQVIDNVILNSIQAMPSAGVIDVIVENISIDDKNINRIKPGDYLRVKIKDYGKGIPKNIINNIFDPFFTTKLKRHGLGLSISHSIINKHNGYIFAESELDVYTLMTIYLPASEKQVIEEEYSGNVYQLGSGKIIVMDDEELVRDTYKYMLEALGYKVILTTNGYEMLDIFKSLNEKNDEIDAIILDLTIPGSLGGKDTIQEIRKINQDIPVFVASGYTGDPAVINPQDYGFTDNLPKPFEMSELSLLIHKYLIKSD